MPDMDGFQLAEHIARETASQDTTLIMLTSDRLSVDHARLRELGIAQYLVKPVKRSDLLEISAAMGKPITVEVPADSRSPTQRKTCAP